MDEVSKKRHRKSRSDLGSPSIISSRAVGTLSFLNRRLLPRCAKLLDLFIKYPSSRTTSDSCHALAFTICTSCSDIAPPPRRRPKFARSDSQISPRMQLAYGPRLKLLQLLYELLRYVMPSPIFKQAVFQFIGYLW
jgi:hypothetical protein